MNIELFKKLKSQHIRMLKKKYSARDESDEDLDSELSQEELRRLEMMHSREHSKKPPMMGIRRLGHIEGMDVRQIDVDTLQKEIRLEYLRSKMEETGTVQEYEPSEPSSMMQTSSSNFDLDSAGLHSISKQKRPMSLDELVLLKNL